VCDEIYVLRAQRRSEFRKSGKANLIKPQVLLALLAHVTKHLRALTTPKGNLKTRLARGILIGELATPVEKA
jgi:hypothetical protein